MACLYIPSTWAEQLARAPALEQLFGIYRAQWAALPNEGAAAAVAGDDGSPALCLQCIVLLAVVRPSSRNSVHVSTNLSASRSKPNDQFHTF